MGGNPTEAPPSPITTEQLRNTANKEVNQFRTDATAIGRRDDTGSQPSEKPPGQLPTVRKNEAKPRGGTSQNGQQGAEQVVMSPVAQNPILGNTAAPILKDPEQGWGLTQMVARTLAGVMSPNNVRDSAFQATSDDWVHAKLMSAWQDSRKSTTPLWYAADQLAQQLALNQKTPQGILWAGLSAMTMLGHQDPLMDAAIEQHLPGWTPIAGRYAGILQQAKTFRRQDHPGGFDLGGALGVVGHFLFDAPVASLQKMPADVYNAANQLIAEPFKQAADVLGGAGHALDVATGKKGTTPAGESSQVLDAMAGLSLLGAGEGAGAEAGALKGLPKVPKPEPMQEALRIASVPAESVRAKGGKAPTIPNLAPGDIYQKNIPKDVRQKLGVDSYAELIQKVKEDHLSDAEVKYLASSQRWNNAMTYPLVRKDPEDLPRTNPWQHIEELPTGDKKMGTQAILQANNLISAIKAGPIHAEDPASVPGSMVRSIGGVKRASDDAHNLFFAQMTRLTKDLPPDEFHNMRRAMQGRQDVFDSLSPKARLAVSIARNVDAVIRDEHAQAGYPITPTPNYFPEREVRPPGQGQPRGSGLLTGENKAHRQETFVAGPNDQLQLTQRFQDIDALNAERARQRRETVQKLVTGDPERGIEAIEPKVARQQAAILHPPFQGDWRIWLQDVDHRIQAFHSWQAVQEALHAKVNATDAEGNLMNMAYQRGAMSESEQRLADADGYRKVGFGAHDDILWHPKAADLLEKVNAIAGRDTGLAGGLRKVEREAVQLIMYSPMFHSWNVGGRLGAWSLTHPAAALHSLLTDIQTARGQVPEGFRDAADYNQTRRREFIEAGGMPPVHSRAPEFSNSWAYSAGDPDLASHIGTQDLEGAPITLESSPVRDALNVGKSVAGAYQNVNQFFWNRYFDAAVAVYHVEKEANLARGETEAAARLMAADRANAIIGHVRPERYSPFMRTGTSIAFFAANWWRSLAETMLPIYDRAGLDPRPGRLQSDVVNSVRTIGAMLAFQQLSGNLINQATSGHWQYQNQPGNRDKLELDRFVPPDAQGRHAVAQNPLARQQGDVERALGINTTSKLPQLEFLASRLSPLLQSAALAGNIDLYQSAHQNQLVHVDPGHYFSPAELGAAVAALMPQGQTVSGGIEQAAQDASLGPYNTRKPKSMMDMAGNFAKSAAFGLVGLNAPYIAAPDRSIGTNLTQDQWAEVNTRQNAYVQAEKDLSDKLLSGGVPPNEWLAHHKSLADPYHQFLSDTFKNAPYYTSGPLGMYHDWVSLYDQAKNQYGEIDWGKYDELAANFTAKHTAAEMAGLAQQQVSTELKIPALKLFRDTNDAYRSFQEQQAQQMGIPVEQLRASLTQESHVFNDSAALKQFTGQHPELRSYAKAKQVFEESTLAGLLYGLYYNSSTVLNFLHRQGMSAEQVIQKAEQAEGATP